MQFNHTPVLLDEVVALFKENGVTRFVDGTLGGAGHSSAILEAIPEAKILGIDRDSAAVAAATERLGKFEGRAIVAKGEYSDMEAIAKANGFGGVNGVLLDIGVSSVQIDSPERGFSFRFNGPLDMRMDQSARRSALDVVNGSSEEELTRFLFLGRGGIAELTALQKAALADIWPFDSVVENTPKH